MNINLASILSGSMKILNVVNKTLPLVKEFNPTIKKFMTKIKTTNSELNKVSKPTKSNNISTKQKLVEPTNSLTFFK